MSRRVAGFVAALFIPALAHAADRQKQFTQDGVSYRYTVSEQRGGQVIEGRSNGEPFRLFVKNGRVNGTVNGRSVSFYVREAASNATVQVAAR
ncbi:hypothetical protein HJG53_04555 [Sphingomonas sp. ID1715]|uniref:hypothetical protein n=1 Tax=Sphingomonas sp. ID1715 TaxID=1656898 RepID=UPI0014888099|nr:hypothetical protein [Sphingomonas sp. ID1715]NNM76176.1 hypothetical protein [Sphingomonas sp. ID1715]